tara:strand:- start:1166 stop:1354 length:189 start_codon:yes stop_codon:yes gene_type:complete
MSYILTYKITEINGSKVDTATYEDIFNGDINEGITMINDLNLREDGSIIHSIEMTYYNISEE